MTARLRRRNARPLVLLSLLAGISAQSQGTGGVAQPGKTQPGKTHWRQLFNGKDLSGWKVKIAGHDLGDNYRRTFRVENGVMSSRIRLAMVSRSSTLGCVE